MNSFSFLLISGVGLFCDGWLNIGIGLVVPILGYVYFQDQDATVKSAIPTLQASVIKASLSMGMIIGQLAFGVFGDALGRHRVYGKELLITIFGTLMVILLPWKGLSHDSIVAWICVFRAVTGIGTGADYPQTSSLSAEQKRFGSRARLILSVFSFIGLGTTIAGIVCLILVSAFGSGVNTHLDRFEYEWRLLLGLAIIPCALTVYARLRMPMTKPYEQYVNRQGRDLAMQWREFSAYFSQWRHARVLIAQSLVWFLFDIAYYGVNLNQSIILSKIGYGKGKTPYENMHNLAVGNVIANVAGYLPGFYIAIFLPDLIGRKVQQMAGCAFAGLLYAIWAGVINHAGTASLMTLFTLSQLFLNAGPNATTFLLPVELFPTRVRATAHGISAASGKCGALLTALVFGTVVEHIGVQGVLWLLAGIMALCVVLTIFVPETKNMSLEQIESGALYGEDSLASPTQSIDETVHVLPEKVNA